MSDQSAAPQKQTPKRLWYALDVTTEPAALEAVQYALMEAGAMGTEVSTTSKTVTAYFDSSPDHEKLRNELHNSLTIYSLPSSSVTNMLVREVAEQDWLAEWKKDWQPVEIGERFIVAPSWSEIQNKTDRLVIQIDPGMAFGTGTHETTRLCLHAIEKYFEGQSFVDVGTGTGILAIAAAKLNPLARIEAYDTDADAVSIARRNAELNDVSAKIKFLAGPVDDTVASADCVCANLTTETIVELLSVLLGATCGRLICSGILEVQLPIILDALQQSGVTNPTEVMVDGEWVCVIV
jgi:ribosomal protein L11 methyltransferase